MVSDEFSDNAGNNPVEPLEESVRAPLQILVGILDEEAQSAEELLTTTSEKDEGLLAAIEDVLAQPLLENMNEIVAFFLREDTEFCNSQLGLSESSSRWVPLINTEFFDVRDCPALYEPVFRAVIAIADRAAREALQRPLNSDEMTAADALLNRADIALEEWRSGDQVLLEADEALEGLCLLEACARGAEIHHEYGAAGFEVLVPALRAGKMKTGLSEMLGGPDQATEIPSPPWGPFWISIASTTDTPSTLRIQAVRRRLRRPSRHLSRAF